ncbi:hypothetical protein [Algimonas arctica]|nr:hypothetical protein [Algimonas arctica]
MSDNKTDPKKSREDRLAAQLRANLRRRKVASRKASELDRPKKDAPQP